MYNPENLIVIAGLAGLIAGIYIGVKWKRDLQYARSQLQAVRLQRINLDFDIMERRIFGRTIR